MKKSISVRVVLVIMVTAATALYFATEFTWGQGVFSRGDGIMTFIPTGTAIEFDSHSRAQFYAPGGRGFFFATRDGIGFISDDGRIQMAESISMQNPILLGEGQTVGVFEPRGLQAYIFNNRGLMYSLSFKNPIVTFAINARGYSATVTRRGDEYETFVYNPSGGRVIRWVASNVIVVSAAISPDGRILALGSLDLSGIQLNSILTFFYLNPREAAPYTNNIFASIRGESVPELNNQIFGIIRFMDGNNLVVVTERTVFAVSESQPSRPAWIIPLDNYLDAVYLRGSHVALAKGRGILNMQPEPMGRVVLLDLNGERIWKYDTGERVHSLAMNPHGTVIGRNRHFTAVDHRGQLLWNYETVFDSRGAIFLDSTSRILLHTGTDASVMRLVRVSGMTK